jgi:TfoX/Sxy family transcriptional regulator of competence genes
VKELEPPKTLIVAGKRVDTADLLARGMAHPLHKQALEALRRNKQAPGRALLFGRLLRKLARQAAQAALIGALPPKPSRWTPPK